MSSKKNKKKNKKTAVNGTASENEQLDLTPETDTDEIKTSVDNEHKPQQTNNAVVENDTPPDSAEFLEDPAQTELNDQDRQESNLMGDADSSETEPEPDTVEPVENSEDTATKTHPLKKAAVLAAICLCVVLLLVAVNGVTADMIRENGIRAKNEAVTAVFPESKAVESYITSDGDEVYIVSDDSGIIGYAVNAVEDGYAGDISMIVGIDTDHRISGVRLISVSEKPGISERSKLDSFIEQFIGMTEPIENAEELYGIDSASYTTRAIAAGVNTALSANVDFDVVARTLGRNVVLADDSPDEHQNSNDENGDRDLDDGIIEAGEPGGNTDTETPDTGETEVDTNTPDEPQPAPEPEPVPEPVAEPEPVVEPEPIPEPEPVVEPEPIVEPEPVVEPEPIPEPVPEPVPEPIPEPDPIVEPEPEPEEPGPTGDIQIEPDEPDENTTVDPSGNETGVIPSDGTEENPGDESSPDENVDGDTSGEITNPDDLSGDDTGDGEEIIGQIIDDGDSGDEENDNSGNADDSADDQSDEESNDDRNSGKDSSGTSRPGPIIKR